MSEERFNRIEVRLDDIDRRLEGIDGRLDRLDAGQARLEVGYVDLKAGLAKLGRHMLVLHEQVIDTIKAIPDPSAGLERKWRADDAALHEEIGRRLDPLEAVVRRHFGT